MRIGCTSTATLVPGPEGTAEKGAKGRGMRRCGALTIEFVDEIYELSPTRLFSFGRAGELQLDTSPELPSVVGVFFHDNGIWWLRNEMHSIDVHVLDCATRSAVLIAAGSTAPVPYENSTLRVVIAPLSYELTLRCSDGVDTPTTRPTNRGEPSLNLEQRQLLTALAEGDLIGADSHGLPSNAEVAHRLQWRITKLNRKLDHLCIKFDKLGVVGLRGSARRLATERRRRLVDHCINTKLITTADLQLLPPVD